MLFFNEIPVRVRYAETDQMGVVHHANYPLYLEMGRTEWLREMGLSYKELELSGIMLPVISMALQYKNSAYYDEVLTVKTSLKKMPTVKLEFDYKISNSDGLVLVEANTILAFVNAATKRPIRCPEYIEEKIAAFSSKL
ncbi:acyl-CoA thioesterase [Bizionia sediminis]|uniref:Acyl-CoA thioesterase n=1 Tax=Bizionia sediminis TaxID=1737064 RepID=A0ABW5KUY7_9FLAO